MKKEGRETTLGSVLFDVVSIEAFTGILVDVLCSEEVDYDLAIECVNDMFGCRSRGQLIGDLKEVRKSKQIDESPYGKFKATTQLNRIMVVIRKIKMQLYYHGEDVDVDDLNRELADLCNNYLLKLDS